MKKTLLVIMVVLCGLSALAQDVKEIKVRRPKYVNVGYVLQQNMTLASGEVIKPEFGATINRGRTYYLHKKPIAKFLNIGIDATWADINYAMYKPEITGTTLHQAGIAMQVGPSITLTPIKRLQLHLYGRFAPTFALRYDKGIDGEWGIGGNYASMFVAGGNISFGFFGIGAEYRKGNVKYKQFNLDKITDAIGGIIGGDDDEEAFVSRAAEGTTDVVTNPFFGTKNGLEGLRIYVSFRF